MSLRENSCFSLCPFLNKDLRLPRQQRLRQAPSATGAASEGHKLQRRFSFLPYFFFSPTFPIVFLSCAVAEQSVLYRKIPTRSNRSAAARSPPPLQPLSCSASHTHFNLKSEPEVPGVLKSLLLWHPSSLGLCPPLHSPAPHSLLQWRSCWMPAASLGKGTALPSLDMRYQVRGKAGEEKASSTDWKPSCSHPCPLPVLLCLSSDSQECNQNRAVLTVSAASPEEDQHHKLLFSPVAKPAGP